MTKPAPPDTPPDGYRWVAVPELAVGIHAWRAIPPADARPCRFIIWEGRRITAARHACGAPSIAALNRGRAGRHGLTDAWWHYCAEHLYGRWVEPTGGGLVVFHWRLEELTA